jgi:hypothetical protein
MEGHLEALLELIFLPKTSKFWSRGLYRAPTRVALNILFFLKITKGVKEGSNDDRRLEPTPHHLTPPCADSLRGTKHSCIIHPFF